MRRNLREHEPNIAWQGSPPRRLALCSLLAALLLAAGLSRLRLPSAGPAVDVVELLVEINRLQLPEPRSREVPPVAQVQPADLPVEVPGDTGPPDRSAVGEQSVEDAASPIDWQALRDLAAREAAGESLRSYTVNPGFERTRAAAAEQFRPSEAPEKRYIRDNVEKDYLGRTILRAGDCYRVLDVPGAVYRDIFETFTQYLVFCAGGRSGGIELPWVADVRERHGYLQQRIADRERALPD